MAPKARIDYKTAARSSMDARHQPNDVKAPGAPGSARHSSGAGIAHEQNRLPISEAGTGSRSGAKGGPSEHPQNRVGASSAGQVATPARGPQTEGSPGEEAGESAAFEAMEQHSGLEAGTGSDGRGGQGGGATADHAQNRLAAGSAGTGADGKGGKGGGAQPAGGHAQGKLLPAKTKSSAAKPAKAGPPKKAAGYFLSALNRGAR